MQDFEYSPHLCTLRPEGRLDRWSRTDITLESFELQPIFPTSFNGHGFLIRNSARDYTMLQEGPLCLLFMLPWKGNYSR